jgi:3,4-dihydroxy 2-butanone 4-phosphate synthase / GTP cyclohydrolase II
MSNFERVQAAVEAFREGKFIVVADDASRENEGDLIARADLLTPADVAFLVRHTSGLLCVALPGERLDALGLPLMVQENSESHKTAFTISVDAAHGTTTGISAADRALTLRALADPRLGPEAFVRPGHVFPLRGKVGGVLERPGHTEAGLELARLARTPLASVLCELVRDDGEMMRGAELQEFANQHDLPFLRIQELVEYVQSFTRLVEHSAVARIPTQHGAFDAHVFRGVRDGLEHVALVRGEIRGVENLLVRVHSECFTGDVLGSRRCDCGEQLDLALKRVAEEGRGVVVYLRGHEGRGIGLSRKLHAYQLQDSGRDTVDANLDLGLPVDARRYDVGAQILADLGVSTIRLLSNNPKKITGLSAYNLRIVERVPLLTEPNADNASYLWAKQLRMGHALGILDSSAAAGEAVSKHAAVDSHTLVNPSRPVHAVTSH